MGEGAAEPSHAADGAETAPRLTRRVGLQDDQDAVNSGSDWERDRSDFRVLPGPPMIKRSYLPAVAGQYQADAAG